MSTNARFHWALLTLFAASSLACARRPAGAPVNRPQFARIAAELTIRRGENVELFALNELDPVPWAHVGWLPVRPGVSTGASASAVGDSASVLFVVSGYVFTRHPILYVRALELRPRASYPPGEIEQADVRHDADPAQCRGGSWVSAFFVDGIGARLIHPVVLRFQVDGVVHRLRVDPQRSTLPGRYVFRIARPELLGDDSSGTRMPSLSIRVSDPAPEVRPIVIFRDSRGWHAVGGQPAGKDGGSFGWARDSHGNPPVEEARILLLGALPACPGEPER